MFYILLQEFLGDLKTQRTRRSSLSLR